MSGKGPIFVLSIDGGGSRGVIPANVLNFIELEEQISVRKEFDFFAGVSTGALVAAYLARNVGGMERLVTEGYTSESMTRIFDKSIWDKMLGRMQNQPKYDGVNKRAYIYQQADGRMKSLSEAVSEGASRMFNLLEKHDPRSANYLATFSFALARIAYADGEVHQSERNEMRRILHEVAKLETAEVEFIMELSMMLKRTKSGADTRISNPALNENRAEHFLESLYAIARADGSVSSEELVEIEAIAKDFGLMQDANPASD